MSKTTQSNADSDGKVLSETTSLSGGLSFSQKGGFGASLDASYSRDTIDPSKGNSDGLQMPELDTMREFSGGSLGLSFNQRDGFSADLSLDGINALSYTDAGGLRGNTNFAMDTNTKLREENRQKVEDYNKALAAKNELDKKHEWAEKMREEHPDKYANIKDDDELVKVFKAEMEKVAEKNGSREGFIENALGDAYDDVMTSLGIGTSATGYLDEKGNFVPRTCFVAGTKVKMETGYKVIEDVEVGDVVLSWNEKTGKREYKEVTNLWVRETTLLYEVKLPGQDAIITTWNHPFWSVTQSAWIETKDLKEGEILSLEDGSETSIESITHYETEDTTVYNFEVEGNHTYYVSEAGVLVHNQSKNGTYGNLDKATRNRQNAFLKSQKKKAQKAIDKFDKEVGEMNDSILKNRDLSDPKNTDGKAMKVTKGTAELFDKEGVAQAADPSEFQDQFNDPKSLEFQKFRQEIKNQVDSARNSILMRGWENCTASCSPMEWGSMVADNAIQWYINGGKSRADGLANSYDDQNVPVNKLKERVQYDMEQSYRPQIVNPGYKPRPPISSEEARYIYLKSLDKILEENK